MRDALDVSPRQRAAAEARRPKPLRNVRGGRPRARSTPEGPVGSLLASLWRYAYTPCAPDDPRPTTTGRQEVTLSSNTWVRLRTTPALEEDVGSNRIRLDGPTRRHLELATDDIVEIRAFRGVQWARVHPDATELDEIEHVEIEHVEIGLARIDEARLGRIGVETGEWIFVRAAEPVPARKVTLEVADRSVEQLIASDGLRSLVGHTVIEGDTLHIELLEREQTTEANLAIVGLSLATLEMSRGRIGFAEADVTRTDPKGPVTVQGTTIIRLESHDDEQEQEEG